MKNAKISIVCFSIASVISLVVAVMNDSVFSLIAGGFFLMGAIIEYKNRNKES